MRRIFYYYNSHGALIFTTLSAKRYGDSAMNFICSANI